VAFSAKPLKLKVTLLADATAATAKNDKIPIPFMFPPGQIDQAQPNDPPERAELRSIPIAILCRAPSVPVSPDFVISLKDSPDS
jgi:hypothetical protein